MQGEFVGPVFGLIGVALGGGLQAAGSVLARKHLAKSVLSALVAEVASLTDLATRRDYLAAFEQEQAALQTLVDQGKGDTPCRHFSLSAHHDYFAVFDSLRSQIGTIDAEKASAIVTFYVLAKAFLEDSLPSSGWCAESHPASELLVAVTNDVELLKELLRLGDDIAQFRP